MKRSLVFTAFNRPDYFSTTIDTWNQVRNLKSWNVTVFIEPSPLENVMADLAMKLNTNVTTVINPVQLGVLVNPWNALETSFIAGADFTVLAEDDVVVSQDTLEFFEWSSEEYQTAKKLLAVNAFSQIGGPKANQVAQAGNFSPLVWGVWKNRWEDILRDTWDKDYSSGNADGSESGWDWNINRIMQQNSYTVIKPLQSRSDHIGEYFGTHMTPDLYESSRGVDFQLVRGKQRYNEI